MIKFKIFFVSDDGTEMHYNLNYWKLNYECDKFAIYRDTNGLKAEENGFKGWEFVILKDDFGNFIEEGYINIYYQNWLTEPIKVKMYINIEF